MTDGQDDTADRNPKTKLTGPAGSFDVELNEETCSLCEMCARKCPTAALTLNEAGEKEQLVFEYGKCTACGGEILCETHCPEDAIKVVRVRKGAPSPEEERVLIEGDMVGCPDCGRYFAPAKKLETLVRQEKVERKEFQRYCPLCRRKRLIENYPTDSAAQDEPEA